MSRKLNETVLPTHNAVEELSKIEAEVLAEAHDTNRDLYLIVDSGEEPGYDFVVNVGLYTAESFRAGDTLIFMCHCEGPDKDFIYPEYGVFVNVGYDGDTLSLDHHRAFRFTTDDEGESRKVFDRILSEIFTDIDLEKLAQDVGAVGKLQDVAANAAIECGLEKGN